MLTAKPRTGRCFYTNFRTQPASMPQTSGSLGLGLDGVVVESVHVDVDQTRTIHVVTALEWV